MNCKITVKKNENGGSCFRLPQRLVDHEHDSWIGRELVRLSYRIQFVVLDSLSQFPRLFSPNFNGVFGIVRNVRSKAKQSTLYNNYVVKRFTIDTLVSCLRKLHKSSDFKKRIFRLIASSFNDLKIS